MQQWPKSCCTTWAKLLISGLYCNQGCVHLLAGSMNVHSQELWQGNLQHCLSYATGFGPIFSTKSMKSMDHNILYYLPQWTTTATRSYILSGLVASPDVLNSRSSKGNTTLYESFVYRCSWSMYLNLFRCRARIIGSFLTFILKQN